MTPNLQDANIEYSFLPSESIAARILDQVRICWYQTKYAQLWKMRNSIPASEDATTDRSYFLKVAELDGKLSMIQEILDDHKQALAEMEATNLTQTIVAGTESAESIADRASKQVHHIKEI